MANWQERHEIPGYGEYYDTTYSTGYYGAQWLQIERPLLEALIRPFGGTGKNCLDFACGTGRITGLVADLFEHVVGVDLSQAMLSHAKVFPNVRFLQWDIIDNALPDKFDVVTAFRFFLNAEEQIRKNAIAAIHRQLKDGGRLICNIHVNASSPSGVISQVANFLPVARQRNTVSRAHLETLLRDGGFEIENVVYYGYLPGPRFLPSELSNRLMKPAERIAELTVLPKTLAQNFVVVARKLPASPQ